MAKENDILRELDYMIEKENGILDLTDNKDRDAHLMALGQIMALVSLKYSIQNNDWLYKRHLKEKESEK